MKKIAIMDTSVMSFNLGDKIIMESARNGLKDILEDAFVIDMPTHSPLFHIHEFSLRRIDSFQESLNSLNLKFVCGTNLLAKDMKKRKNVWNLYLKDTRYFNDFVLVGVGTDNLEKIQNKYTQRFYEKALSHKYIHSVRDEKTKQFLISLGFEAINTGCVTFWPLTKEHCAKIPIQKSNTVIFTITDYCTDKEMDYRMIKALVENYEHVFCWIQGILDEKYLEELNLGEYLDDINFIAPSLQAYNDFLMNNDCDYVGTRLHAGIKAIQCGKRALIIGVDNRARDINETYNINYLERSEIEKLEDVINNPITTNLNIDEDKIKTFINQFV